MFSPLRKEWRSCKGVPNLKYLDGEELLSDVCLHLAVKDIDPTIGDPDSLCECWLNWLHLLFGSDRPLPVITKDALGLHILWVSLTDSSTKLSCKLHHKRKKINKSVEWKKLSMWFIQPLNLHNPLKGFLERLSWNTVYAGRELCMSIKTNE